MADEDNKQQNVTSETQTAALNGQAAFTANSDAEREPGTGGNTGVRDEGQPKVNERQPSQKPAPDRHINSDDILEGDDANQGNKDAEETLNNDIAGEKHVDGPPSDIQFYDHNNKPVTHMDMLNNSLEIDARRARIRNGTATEEDIAIQEKAKPVPQPVPAGFAGQHNDLTTHPNALHPNEKPEQPIGSTKDLNGKELVQQNLPKAKEKAAPKWSSSAQVEKSPAKEWQ
jgi:hypothetical protein